VKSSKNTVGEIVEKEVDFFVCVETNYECFIGNLVFGKKKFYRQDFSFTL